MSSTTIVLLAALTLASGGKEEPEDANGCYGKIVACADVCRYVKNAKKSDACLMRCIADYQTCVNESK